VAITLVNIPGSVMEQVFGPEEFDGMKSLDDMISIMRSGSDQDNQGLLLANLTDAIDPPSKGLFLSPAGKLIYLEGIENLKIFKKLGDQEAGINFSGYLKEAIYGYTINGKEYFADISENVFHGYYLSEIKSEYDEFPEIGEYDFTNAVDLNHASFSTGEIINIPISISSICTFKLKDDNGKTINFSDYKANGVIESSYECIYPKDYEVYFVTNKIAKYYVEFFQKNSLKVDNGIQNNENLISSLLNIVNKDKNTNIKNEKELGEILADKLKTYEIFNNRKFIVTFHQTNIISVDQKSWNLVAKNVFEKANLSSTDILITIPYVQCKGIGGDLGEFYFMPGLAYGQEVQLDLSELKLIYNNTQKVLSFNGGTISPIEYFIFDVFTHTANKMLLYKAIFNASNTVECVIIEKDNISGQPFNKSIKLYQQNAVAELARLINTQKTEIERIKDEYTLYISDIKNNPKRITAAKYHDINIKNIEIRNMEARLSFLASHANDQAKSDFTAKFYDLKIKEEYLDAAFVHETTKNLNHDKTFALAYIYSDAFNELRAKLDYQKENLSLEYSKDWIFNSQFDYFLKQYDYLIYNSIDGASLVLGFFGLDFMADGLGVGYSVLRGDYVQAGGYATSFLFIGPEGVVVQKATTSALIILFTKQGFKSSDQIGKQVLLELAQKYVDEGAISKEVFQNLQNLEEKELASALKSALNGVLSPSQLAFVSKLDPKAIDLLSKWDTDILLKLEKDLSENITFANKFIELTAENPGVVDSWDILRKNGRTDLKLDIPSLEALNKIRKHSRLSELGLTDDMLGRIQGIDNVSYVQMLDEVEKAMNALPAGKTKDFSKIIQHGEKRGLVNTDPTNGIYDRRHSWLTLKVIQDNSDFLKKADAIEFEAALETIDGIPQSVPDIKLTISEGGVTKAKIGEVYAGTAGAKSNLASQSLTYFNAVADINDLRLFRRMNVADKTVAKSAVIDAWQKGGVTKDQKVRDLFTDYYNRINDAEVTFTQTQLENFLTTNDSWFDLIFNSSF